MKEVKDVIGQTIENGDLVASASKSSDTMVFRVMRDVSRQTALRVNQVQYGPDKGKWKPADKVARMHTMERTLKIPDEIFVNMNPELFKVMIEVRKNLNLPTNANVKGLDALRRMLEMGI